MGVLVSKLLSNDMRTLELVMSEIASAVRYGHWEQLMHNEPFWSLVSTVSSNAGTLQELRGYVSSLLEEDWRTSSLLLDMISPGLTSTQRRFAVSLVKLECIARTLRSDIFWSLVLDRTWVTGVWKVATGRQCSDAEAARLGLDRRNNGASSGAAAPGVNMEAATPETAAVAGASNLTGMGRNPGRRRSPRRSASADLAASAGAGAGADAQSQSAAGSSVPAEAAAAVAAGVRGGSQSSDGWVAPPPASRFFTVLCLPSVLALLEDIARSPDAPPVPMPMPIPAPAPVAAAPSAAPASKTKDRRTRSRSPRKGIKRDEPEAKAAASAAVAVAAAAPAIPAAGNAVATAAATASSDPPHPSLPATMLVAALSPLRPAHPTPWSSNLILLLYRDLLKLEHIFERERLALLPPPVMAAAGGGASLSDLDSTGLGMSRTTYVFIRAAIKFALCGSGKKGHGHEHPNVPSPTEQTQHQQHHAAAAPGAPGRGKHSGSSGGGGGHNGSHISNDNPSNTGTHSLSYLAQLLLDPDFQSRFLTREFFGGIFQQKLLYYTNKWPRDSYAAGVEGLGQWDQTQSPPNGRESGSLDAHLSASLGRYAHFFSEVFSDPFVVSLGALASRHDALVLEHMAATAWTDVVLPLLRPEQYVRNVLAGFVPRSGSGAGASAAYASGAAAPAAPGVISADGNDPASPALQNRQRGGGGQPGLSQPSTAAGYPSQSPAQLLAPPLAPFAPPAHPPPARAPLVAPLPLLIAVGFVYHWLFEPVPTPVLQHSKSVIDAMRARAAAHHHPSTSGPAASAAASPGAPSPLGGLDRLRDLLLRMDLNAEWAGSVASSAPNPVVGQKGRLPLFSTRMHAALFHPSATSTLEFLQVHTAHVASCLAKTLDELNMLCAPPPPPPSSLARHVPGYTPTAAAFLRAPLNSDGGSSDTPADADAPQPTQDMFSPRLSFHGENMRRAKPPQYPAQPMPQTQTQTQPQTQPQVSASSPSSTPPAAHVTQSQPPQPSSSGSSSGGGGGWLSWLWGGGGESSKPVPAQPPRSQPRPQSSHPLTATPADTMSSSSPPTGAAAAAAAAAAASLSSPLASLYLPPLLAPSRTRCDFHLQRQLRLWCNRVLEGRGFTQLFAAQAQQQQQQAAHEQAHSAPYGYSPAHGLIPSTAFVLQAHAFAQAQGIPRSAMLPPLMLSAPTLRNPPRGGAVGGGGGAVGSGPADAFYIELLVFDPGFLEQLFSLVYTYAWTDARDEYRRVAKLRSQQQRQEAGAPLSSSKTPTNKNTCSALFPSVALNMSRAASTPIDLGPIRPRESLALLCAEVGALLAEDHVAVYLSRSDAVWNFLLDTSWWDMVLGAGGGAGAEAGAGDKKKRKKKAKGRAVLQDSAAAATDAQLDPIITPSSRGPQGGKTGTSNGNSPSALHALLTLVSRKSSAYSVLLELGQRGQFEGVFSEGNIERVLAALRLICSWQVHEVMNRYDQARIEREKRGEVAATQQQSSADGSAAPLSSSSSSSPQDLYATLTAPFTFWGVVHSLSVVAPLRAQYKGAIHWFLSKRNMDMQVEIWKIVKETLYGEEEQEEEGEAPEAATQMQAPQGTTPVPAPAPLHAGSGGVSSRSFSQQKVRLARLRSLSHISKSVHNSGILQAIFTFPLATAHCYSLCVSELLWPTNRRTIGAHFGPVSSAADAARRRRGNEEYGTDAQPGLNQTAEESESATSVLLSQLGAVLHTAARVASVQGFMSLPSIRSAFLEGVALALEETVAYGSGAAERAAQQAKIERDRARRERIEARRALEAERARLALEQQRREAQVLEAKEAERKSKSGGGGRSGRSKRQKDAQGSATPSPVPRPTPPAAVAPPDMFDASTSYRLPTNSAAAPTTDLPPLSAALLQRGAATPHRAVVRAQSELDKLLPSTSTTSIPAAEQPEPPSDASLMSTLPSSVPARLEREADIGVAEEQAAAAAAANASRDLTSASTSSSSGGSHDSTAASSGAEHAVSLPPPFSFEVVVDEDDEERSGAHTATATGAQGAPNGPASVSTTSAGRETLHTESHLELLSSPEFTGSAPSPSSATPAPASTPALPVIPSLPQRHRLLYSFFQLLLAQPVLKLLLTCPALWEMLSDVAFLELLAVLLFGPITDESGPGSGAGTKSPLGAARALFSSSRASLHAWQRLVAHWRFGVLIESLRSLGVEESMAQSMKSILEWLATDRGQALILAVMDGLQQQSPEPGADAGAPFGSAPPAAATAAAAPLGLAARFHSLTSLLSHRSTVSLLTSPLFWSLLTSPATLRYFSQGKFLRLWIHSRTQLRELQLRQPVWQIIKTGGQKVATRARNQAANKLAQHAQRLAAPASPSPYVGLGGALVDGGASEWGEDSASGSLSKRQALKGFVKAKLSRTAASAAARLAAPPVTTSGSVGSGGADEADRAAPPGLAALQHFFTLLQTVHSLLFGSATAQQTPLRSSL